MNVLQVRKLRYLAFPWLFFLGFTLVTTAQSSSYWPFRNVSRFETWFRPPSFQERRNSVPFYVFDVLRYIEQHYGEPPYGFIGGRRFGNYDRKLPVRAFYREYDVHPWRPERNRGPERLVRSNTRQAWYTPDHYRTFIKIK